MADCTLLMNIADETRWGEVAVPRYHLELPPVVEEAGEGRARVDR